MHILSKALPSTLRLLTAALVLLSVLPFTVPAAGAAEPVVSAVRLGDHGQTTRFVMEVDSEVPFRLFTLPGPYRLVIDMPSVSWRVSGGSVRTAGVVEGLRFGQFRADTSRVVIDLRRPVAVREAFFIPPRDGHPYRFVLDLEASPESVFLSQKADAMELAVLRTAPVPEARPRTANDRPVVVIDPGHGGVDPGATGVSGIYEKQIVLETALELRDQLVATGRYRVLMTRDSDVFVPLRERVAFAQRAGASLFVSVHADAIRNRRVRGMSVHTLSENASDSVAQELVETENKADLIAGVDLSVQPPDVSSILIDLARRETMNVSSEFAELLVETLGGGTKLLGNPHRFAGFVVLKAPDVPSVLVELGFLSNPQDERELREPGHRRRMASLLAKAVNRWFDLQERRNRT